MSPSAGRDPHKVSATVTNTGDFYSGKEVVQGCLQRYIWEKATCAGKTRKVMAAKAETKLLEPGEPDHDFVLPHFGYGEL